MIVADEWVLGAAGLSPRGSVPDFPQWGSLLIVARISGGSGGGRGDLIG